MIVPLLQHATARLTDGATGVNAQLGQLPAATPVPAVVHVFAEHTAAIDALSPVDDALLADGPVLSIAHLGASSLQVGDGMRGEVQLLIRYAAPASASATLAADAWQTLRAAARALVAPAVAAAPAAATARVAGAAIGVPTLVSYVSPALDGSAVAYGPALVVHYPASDPWALGA